MTSESVVIIVFFETLTTKKSPTVEHFKNALKNITTDWMHARMPQCVPWRLININIVNLRQLIRKFPWSTRLELIEGQRQAR